MSKDMDDYLQSEEHLNAPIPAKPVSETTIKQILTSLLHKHDHEPDEITKYVVIDQTEYVPEATKAITDYIMELIGEDEELGADGLRKSDGANINQFKAELRDKLKGKK